MLSIQIGLIVEVVAMLSHAKQYAHERKHVQPPPHLDPELPESGGALLQSLLRLRDNLMECGLTVTAESLGRIAEGIASKKPVTRIAVDIGIFNQVLVDEFKAKGVFVLSDEQSKYNRTALELFGEKTCMSFPSIADDAEDAGKCLCFRRGTATVFHLMRIMEAGLRCIAQPLGIPYAPSWESYIKQINSRIEGKHKSKGVQWKKDQAFFRDVMGDLTNVKIAWRNPTMHIDRRYSPDEAEDVFRAVKTFMQRLSTRFHEGPRA
jgi:hypothetical protein